MQLNVRQKLLVAVLSIMCALVYFAGNQVVKARDQKVSANTIYQFVELSAHNSRLVHELQKERGMSAGFLGSKGTKFADKLLEQRRETDKRLTELDNYIAGHELLLRADPTLWRVVQSAKRMLSNIEPMRRGITAQNTPLADALSYYTTLNGHLLSVPGLAMGVSEMAEVSRSLAAYFVFLQGKERAGIERAVLSNTFSQEAFAPGMFRRFVTLVSEQNTYLSSFRIYAKQEHIEAYALLESQPPFQEVVKYRELAFSGELAQNPESWFAASSRRINLLKQQEEYLTQQILTLASDIVSEQQSAFWTYLLLALAMILCSGSFSYVLVVGISRQVNALNDTISLAAQKDLTVRCPVIGKDELSSIAVHLNSMLDEFSMAVLTIASSSEQLAAASEESTVTVRASAVQLKHEQAQVLQVVSAIEEMSASVKEVAHNIAVASTEAYGAKAQVADSGKLVAISTDSISQVSGSINDVSKTITQLHASSSEISSVVDVIQEIAEQTNLLALNAAIEAARAGEAGRGFAVVADEVRSLAQRTQVSTQKIEQMVRQLQENSDSAFNQVKEAKARVAVSVDCSEQVEQSLQSVVGSIGSISQMAEQIVAAAEQQAVVSGDISANTQEISDSVQCTAANGEQIALAAKEQAELADGLQSLSTQFRVA